MIISIDGPAGSGKSTVAEAIAERLGIYYVSTGYLYRALAYILSHYYNYDRTSIANPDMAHVKEAIDRRNLVYDYRPKQGVYISFKGENITPHLKAAEIDDLSSIVSAHPQVRRVLIQFQRSFTERHDVVMEGRDIGSVILPQADLKIFLTASPQERARRWQKDQKKKGKTYSFRESLSAITGRDRRDKNRKVSPLIVPEGACIVDVTELNKDEMIRKILSLVSMPCQT